MFAAASLKTALDAALSDFEAETGVKTAASYAGSSVLARQIQLGAPADLFISANQDWMDLLGADGHLAPGTRRDMLGNSLVLIAHGADAPELTLADLPSQLGTGRLAMALVSAVPAGIYGKAALEAAGLWDALAPQIAQADNVRAALALVATGEAPFGIVYATDARAETRVTVVARIDPATHAPIVYPAALTSRARSAHAHTLLSYLTGPKAADRFLAQGFTVLAE